MAKLTFGVPISKEDLRKIACYLVPEYSKLPANTLPLVLEEISTLLAIKHALEITTNESGEYYMHSLFALDIKPRMYYKYKSMESVLGRQLSAGPLMLPDDIMIG